MRSTRFVAALAALLTVAACGARPVARVATIDLFTRAALSSVAPNPAPAVTLPPVDGRLDHQIGGAYPSAEGVAIVARDRGDRPAEGKYNI